MTSIRKPKPQTVAKGEADKLCAATNVPKAKPGAEAGWGGAVVDVAGVGR